jgi:hypothetical protein
MEKAKLLPLFQKNKGVMSLAKLLVHERGPCR